MGSNLDQPFVSHLKFLSHSGAILRRWDGDLKIPKTPWDPMEIWKNKANIFTFSITGKCHDVSEECSGRGRVSSHNRKNLVRLLKWMAIRRRFDFKTCLYLMSHNKPDCETSILVKNVITKYTDKHDQGCHGQGKHLLMNNVSPIWSWTHCEKSPHNISRQWLEFVLAVREIHGKSGNFFSSSCGNPDDL